MSSHAHCHRHGHSHQHSTGSSVDRRHSHGHEHAHEHAHGGHSHGPDFSALPTSPEEATKFFNEAAAGWEEKPGVKQLAADVLASLQRHLPWDALRWPECTAMDFGAGVGMVSVPLAAKCRKVVALDSSENMLKTLKARQARERAEQPQEEKKDDNIETICMILDESSIHTLGNQRFDLIFISMVAHHLAELESTFQLLASLLAPNGVLAVFDMEQNERTHLFHDPYAKKHAGVIADFGFTPAFMSQLFEKLGLHVNFCGSEFAIRKRVQPDENNPSTEELDFNVLGVFGVRKP